MQMHPHLQSVAVLIVILRATEAYYENERQGARKALSDALSMIKICRLWL